WSCGSPSAAAISSSGFLTGGGAALRGGGPPTDHWSSCALSGGGAPLAGSHGGGPSVCVSPRLSPSTSGICERSGGGVRAAANEPPAKLSIRIVSSPLGGTVPDAAAGAVASGVNPADGTCMTLSPDTGRSSNAALTLVGSIPSPSPSGSAGTSG